MSYHPAVHMTIEAGFLPIDMCLLLSEDPQFAQDGVRVAYLPGKFSAMRRVSPIHRYLARHFNGMQEWEIKEIVDAFMATVGPSSDDEFRIVEDMEEIIRLVTTCCDRCRSCMVGKPSFTVENHPYRAYDPRFGWALAVRMRDGQVMARTILYRSSEEAPYAYIRIYGPSNNSEGNATGGDVPLRAWLETRGIKIGLVPLGAKLARVETMVNCVPRLSVPYIDGSTGERLQVNEDHLELVGAYESGLDGDSPEGLHKAMPVRCGGWCYYKDDDVLDINGKIIRREDAVDIFYNQGPFSRRGWMHKDDLDESWVKCHVDRWIKVEDTIPLYDGRVGYCGEMLVQLTRGRGLAPMSETVRREGIGYVLLTDPEAAVKPEAPTLGLKIGDSVVKGGHEMRITSATVATPSAMLSYAVQTTRSMDVVAENTWLQESMVELIT